MLSTTNKLVNPVEHPYMKLGSTHVPVVTVFSSSQWRQISLMTAGPGIGMTTQST